MNDENAARQLSQNPGNDPQKDGERLAGQTPPKYTNPSNVAWDDAERIDEILNMSFDKLDGFFARLSIPTQYGRDNQGNVIK